MAEFVVIQKPIHSLYFNIFDIPKCLVNNAKKRNVVLFGPKYNYNVVKSNRM